MKAKFVAVAALAIAFAIVLPAKATTITFEGVAAPGTEVGSVTPYTEAGFTLTNLQGPVGQFATDFIVNSEPGLNGNGTSYFEWCAASFCRVNPQVNIVIRLTQVGGGAFFFTSLDAATALPGFGLGSQNILVSGHATDGLTYFAVVQLTDAWLTFNLFWGTALLFTSVDFSALNLDTVDPAFDNLVVSAATPLPAALPLFATGLGALGLFGWRRKRKAT